MRRGEDSVIDEMLDMFLPNEKFDKERNAANVELLQILAQHLTDNPTIRFSQALRNLDFVEELRDESGTPISWAQEFYLEPQALLVRVKKALAKL